MTDEPESSMIWLANPLMGDLLNDAAIAEEFTVLILRRLYGEAEVVKQLPFLTTDDGTLWVITGSYQKPGKLPGTGAFFIKVRKSDCRVEKFGHYWPMDIPPEVQEMIAEAKRKRQSS